MDKGKLAPREYFEGVIEKMRELGFELLAWVTMNSERNRYHVDCFGYAQGSRLFFRAPRKAFIVMLELTQHLGRRSYADGTWDEKYHQVYWSGFVDYAYSSRRWIEAEVKRYMAEEYDPFAEPRDLGQLASACLHGSAFEWNGGQFEQKDAGKSRDLLDPEELTRPFGEMFKVLERYLYPRFRRLQVTDYAPHYTFREQESEFWARFPLPRLQRAADRIWGSDFTR